MMLRTLRLPLALTLFVASFSPAPAARGESLAPVALAEASGGETPAPAAAPAPPRRDKTVTFQVVLLVADNATPAVVENVPAKAQRALKDLQDFLPYKSYHLVDMAWLRTSWSATSQITGPKGESYNVEITMTPASGPGERIIVQEFSITRMAMLPPPGASAMATPTPRLIGKLLSSTFGMELGETVVVGTAKLEEPGKALIVLLSAVP